MLFFFYTYRYVGLLYVGTSSTYVYAPLSLSLSHLRRPLLFDFIFFNSFLFFFSFSDQLYTAYIVFRVFPGL